MVQQHVNICLTKDIRFQIECDMGETYRASVLVATSERNEHAILILAGTAQVVTNNLDVEVKVGVSGGLVLEDGDPGRAVLLSNTDVERSPVANVFALAAPLAGPLGGNALGVDVVLSRSGHALPAVVFTSIRAGERVGGAWGRR